MTDQVISPLRVRASRLIEIDYLRAYAVAFVVFLHVVGAYMGMSPRVEVFFRNTDFGSGVDIFFAISGYVISRNLRGLWISNGESRAKSLERVMIFYQKRFTRLWPSAIFWLILGVAFSFIFHRTGFWPSRVDVLKELIAGSVYFANFQQYYAPSVLGYFWSLSVEWQFYLVFPLLLIFVRRIEWRISILLIFLGLSAAFQPGGAGWWMFRFDGIVFGIVSYVVLDLMSVRIPSYRVLQNKAARCAMLICLLAAIAVLPAAIVPSRLGTVFSSAIAAALVGLASLDRDYISTLGVRPFVQWLGSRSYSVYLCHFPCLLAVRSVQAHFIGVDGVLHPTLGQASLALFCTFGAIAIASELSFRFIERPSHAMSQGV